MMLYTFHNSEIFNNTMFFLFAILLKKSKRFRQSIAQELDLPASMNNETINERIEGDI